jgi:hypothetical protein
MQRGLVRKYVMTALMFVLVRRLRVCLVVPSRSTVLAVARGSPDSTGNQITAADGSGSETGSPGERQRTGKAGRGRESFNVEEQSLDPQAT